MIELVSSATKAAKQQGRIFWFRVTSFTATARYRVNEGQWFTVRARQAFLAPKNAPWTCLEFDTEACTADVGTSEDEPFPGACSA